MDAPREPDAPRLPRGRGVRLGGPQLLRIAVVATLLVAVIVLQRPCADAVSGFVTSFEGPAGGGDAGVGDRAVRTPEQVVDPALPDPYRGEYVEIQPGMTEEQIRQVIERARDRAGTGTGTDAGAGAGSGSGAP